MSDSATTSSGLAAMRAEAGLTGMPTLRWPRSLPAGPAYEPCGDVCGLHRPVAGHTDLIQWDASKLTVQSHRAPDLIQYDRHTVPVRTYPALNNSVATGARKPTVGPCFRTGVAQNG